MVKGYLTKDSFPFWSLKFEGDENDRFFCSKAFNVCLCTSSVKKIILLLFIYIKVVIVCVNLYEHFLKYFSFIGYYYSYSHGHEYNPRITEQNNRIIEYMFCFVETKLELFRLLRK